MDAIGTFQRQLWDQSRRVNHRTPISRETEQAYFATPRHLFVPRYREWGSRAWHQVNPDNLEQHLAALYADRLALLCAGRLLTCDMPSRVLTPELLRRAYDVDVVVGSHPLYHTPLVALVAEDDAWQGDQR